MVERWLTAWQALDPRPVDEQRFGGQVLLQLCLQDDHITWQGDNAEHPRQERE